jgi:hypothetical protein
MPEPLPRGANFRRAKFLWEIGLDVAGDHKTPYGGDRDMCIAIGNGSGGAWRPAMRMGTGSPILALDVARGGLEMAMVNPSGFLTQAVRGVGLFKESLPLRIISIMRCSSARIFSRNISAWRSCKLTARWPCGLTMRTVANNCAWRSKKSGVFTRKLAMSSSVIGVIGLFIVLSPSRR